MYLSGIKLTRLLLQLPEILRQLVAYLNLGSSRTCQYISSFVQSFELIGSSSASGGIYKLGIFCICQYNSALVRSFELDSRSDVHFIGGTSVPFLK